jgi:hypothetical protein
VRGTGPLAGLDYWVGLNSWGPRWGEGGKIRLLRNSGRLTGSAGVCGLATSPSVPLGAYGGNASGVPLAIQVDEEQTMSRKGCSRLMCGLGGDACEQAGEKSRFGVSNTMLWGLLGLCTMAMLALLYFKLADRRKPQYLVIDGVTHHPAVGTTTILPPSADFPPARIAVQMEGTFVRFVVTISPKHRVGPEDHSRLACSPPDRSSAEVAPLVSQPYDVRTSLNAGRDLRGGNRYGT